MSSTVTVNVAALVFPLISVTVSITVLAPTLAQSKLSGATLSDATPQLSLLPLSTWPAVIDVFPVASSCTVMSRANATGATLSSTVTVAVAVLVFPLISVTVSITVLAPTLAQSKLSGDTLSDATPQLSLLPLSTWAAVIDVFPAESNCVVISCASATGGSLSLTVIVKLHEALLPEGSVA